MKMLKTRSFEIAANISGDDNSSKIALLLPGRLDTKDYANFPSHAERLAEKGFLVAAIDMPGTWDSPGDITKYSTSTYISVVNELIDYFGNRPTLLLGHSRGGATAMLASVNPAVIAVVVVNAAYGTPEPPDPEKLENGALPEYRDLPPGNVRSEEKRRYNLPLNYFTDGQKYNPAGTLAGFKGPKLLVHASDDEFTKLSKVQDIYSGLPEPKMFLEIDCKHDYRLYAEIIQLVNDVLGEFVDKYLSD